MSQYSLLNNYICKAHEIEDDLFISQSKLAVNNSQEKVKENKPIIAQHSKAKSINVVIRSRNDDGDTHIELDPKTHSNFYKIVRIFKSPGLLNSVYSCLLN